MTPAVRSVSPLWPKKQKGKEFPLISFGAKNSILSWRAEAVVRLFLSVSAIFIPPPDSSFLFGIFLFASPAYSTGNKQLFSNPLFLKEGIFLLTESPVFRKIKK